jgi:4-amino-4-deoxy-L-arabinose transferase-like glycosyltransferase
MHMPAGYSYLLTRDYRLNQEHPPLIKLLSGLGVWKTHPQFPLDSPGWQQAATPRDPEDGMEKIAGAFFKSNADKFDKIALYGRLPMLVIPLLLLLCVWRFTRQLFGQLPALIATLLVATEPNIIGNSIAVQNDVAAALALLVFVMALKRFLTRFGVVDAVLLGGSLGLGLVTKYSLVPLVPVCLLVVIIYGAKELVRKNVGSLQFVSSTCVVFLVAYFVLISFYAFQIKRIDADLSATIASWLYLSGRSAAVFSNFLVRLPLMLPPYFIYGIDMVFQDSRDGRTAFLLGQVSDTGWWYYFPVAIALKTTLLFFITSVSGLMWALVQVIIRKRYVLLYVLLPVICFLGLSMTSHMNIGVRHVLPIFPFLAIASVGVISAATARIAQYRKDAALGFLAIVIVLPCLLIAISSYPNYLTYFSPLAGGSSQGWTKLSDSNVEAGQEVKELATYLKAHGENRVTGMFIGNGFLKFYGVQLLDFPGWYRDDEPDDDDSETDSQSSEDETDASEIQTNYVAIGAWYLAEVDLTDKQKEIIDTYREQRPEAMIGNSIFVFRRVSSSQGGGL